MFTLQEHQPSNRVVTLENGATVLTHWPFLREGLSAVTGGPQAARGDVTEEQFLMMLLNIVNRGPRFGVVALLVSPDGKNLGYGAAVDTTEPFSVYKTATVYIAYNNKICETTTRELLAFGEKWARENKFDSLFACSRRFNAASARLFERVWKFDKHSVVYEKRLK